MSGIHQAYAAAGADVITTHTSAQPYAPSQTRPEDKVREFNFRCALLRDARGRAHFLGNVALAYAAPDQDDARLKQKRPANRSAPCRWADPLFFETFSDLESFRFIGGASLCDLPIVA